MGDRAVSCTISAQVMVLRSWSVTDRTGRRTDIDRPKPEIKGVTEIKGVRTEWHFHLKRIGL